MLGYELVFLYVFCAMTAMLVLVVYIMRNNTDILYVLIRSMKSV